MKAVNERQALVELENNDLSIVQQCILLSINRSGFYYQPSNESDENL